MAHNPTLFFGAAALRETPTGTQKPGRSRGKDNVLFPGHSTRPHEEYDRPTAGDDSGTGKTPHRKDPAPETGTMPTSGNLPSRPRPLLHGQSEPGTADPASRRRGLSFECPIHHNGERRPPSSGFLSAIRSRSARKKRPRSADRNKCPTPSLPGESGRVDEARRQNTSSVPSIWVMQCAAPYPWVRLGSGTHVTSTPLSAKACCNSCDCPATAMIRRGPIVR